MVIIGLYCIFWVWYKLLTAGYWQEQEGELLLTDAGRAAGGTSKKGKFGDFCLWDSGMVI